MACASLLGAPGARASGGSPLSNYHSGKCLDDTGESQAVGNQMDQWTCNGGSNQSWGVYAGGWCNAYDGHTTDCSGASGFGVPVAYVMLRNARSGLCLDLLGGGGDGGLGNGAEVVQWTCDPSDPAQWWELLTTGIKGYYQYLATNSNLCMVISGYSESNGAKVEGWQNYGCDSVTTTAYFWRAGPLGGPPF
jgi:endo-1,4-beta-xylanase